MDSLAVHDIINTELYRINRPDTIVVYGQEIMKSIGHSRLFEDTIIVLNPSFHYTYLSSSDTLMLSGQQIINTFPLELSQPFYPVMAWGACLFGMVLGWNLYFINEKRDQSNISMSDLGLIVAALANGALLSFFDTSNRLLGWYGVGLGFGFLLFGIYLIILMRLGTKNRNSLASNLFKLHVGKTLEE